MAVTRFQDLLAWQKARLLAAEVYRVTQDGPMSRDFGLRDQMRRSAVSVMANIAEGFERNRPLEFARFLEIAKASCGELISHSYVALDVGHLAEAQFERLLAQAEEVARVTAGLLKAVKHGASGPVRDSGPGTRDSA